MPRKARIRRLQPQWMPGDRDEPERGHKIHALKTVWIPLGSLLIATLALFVQKTPFWIVAVTLAYVGIVGLVVLVDPVKRAFHWLRCRRHEKIITRSYYGRLRELIEVLMPRFEESRVDTVTAIVMTAKRWAADKGSIQFDAQHIETLKCWVRAIRECLQPGSRTEFFLTVAELGDLILQYHRLCGDAHNQLDNLVVAGVLAEPQNRELKQTWNAFREKHNHMMATWEDFARNINAAMGEQIGFDRHEPLKTIE